MQVTTYHQANTSNSSSESDAVDETGLTGTSDYFKEATEHVEIADDAISEDGLSCDEDNDATAVRDIQTDSDLKVDTPSSDVYESKIARDTVEDSFGEDHTRLLTGEELVDLLSNISPVKDGALTTVGMVNILCLLYLCIV